MNGNTWYLSVVGKCFVPCVLALIELTDGSYYPAFPRGTNPPRVVRSRDSNDYYCPSSIQYRERVRL